MKTHILMIIAICMIWAMGNAVAQSTLNTISAVSLSLVNQDPDPAIAGDTVDVRVGVQNIGGEALQNMIIEAVESYPFTILPGQQVTESIGTLSGYQGTEGSDLRVVEFKLKVDASASAGDYDFKVQYYASGSGAKTQVSLPISVKSRETAEVIHIDKTTLVPGNIENLTFRINNVGSSPLRDLTFYWDNSDGTILPVGSDNTRYIKYIDMDDFEDLQYQVIADTNAVAGLYKLDLHLSYYDSLNKSTRSISTIAGVYVGGDTDFDVSFSGSSSGQTSFTVANIGANPATSVSVKVPEQRGWQTTGSNSVIIGNLNKGDYTAASFSLSSQNRTQAAASSGAGGINFSGSPSRQDNSGGFRQSNVSSSSVRLQIAYTDTRGNRQLVEKEVNVGSGSRASAASFSSSMRASQSQSFFGKYMWYIIALAAIVCTSLGYYFYKKGSAAKKR